MALDFPAPPWTNGQTYANYVYSSATGAWLSKPLTGPKSTYGPTPPANPNPGDEWVNSNDMTAYGWYVDTDGGQWVEKTAPISANGYYSPNYVINGGFDIWQRGTSISATNNTYTADRWIATPYGSGGSFNVAKGTATPPPGFQNYLKVTPVSSTSVNLFLGHFLETQDVIQFAGQTVTLSFYYRIPTNFTGTWGAQTYYTTGTDEKAWQPVSSTLISTTSLSNTSSWTRSTVTLTVPSGAKSFGIQFASTNNTVSAAEFNVTGVQLELGSAATTFRRNANSLQGELAACQRYYFRITAGNGGSGVPLYAWGCAVNATLADFSFPLPVTLRANASSIDVSNIGVYSILNGTASGGSFTLSYTASNDPQVRYQHGSSLFTSNSLCSIINTTSSAGYISFNAEL